MREQWFHELIYRQVDHGGLVQLGLGKLGFLDETQRSEKRSGRYIDKEQNEYDLLLKSEDGTLVVVEMKRTLDENAVAQVIRYRSSIKRNMGSTPVSCLVAVEINPKTMSVVEELCSAGLDIRVYRLYVDNGHFSIERKENDESGKP
jgi:hypothetical protein